MSFLDAVKKGINKKQIFNYRDRASRSEFWYLYLFYILISIFSSIVYPVGSGSGILFFSFIIVTFILSLAMISVMCRRLHDVGKSGWWQLIGYTIIGIPIILYWLCKNGDLSSNKFGNPVN